LNTEKKSQVVVMMTGAGAPGAPGIIKSLRLNGEREIKIVGVDIDDQFSSGEGMVDYFYKIPSPGNEQLFIDKVLEIAGKHEVRVIIPLVTRELFVFSKHIDQFLEKGIQVLVSDYKPLLIANDKYELMTYCSKNDIPAPEFYKVNSLAAFK
jgi:carbamoyl-phosphate synthase large subunit